MRTQFKIIKGEQSYLAYSGLDVEYDETDAEPRFDATAGWFVQVNVDADLFRTHRQPRDWERVGAHQVDMGTSMMEVIDEPGSAHTVVSKGHIPVVTS